MEPKKKDVMDYAIPIIGIIFAFFLSLHMAVSYENVKDNPIVRDLGDGTYTENFDYVSFFKDFSTRLSTTPDDIQFVSSTPKFLFGTAFVCLLVIGYVATSQRKFINGKEYGTSEWCRPQALAHLRANKILKDEIKKIKKQKASNTEKNKQISEAKEKYIQDSEIIFTQSERICMFNYELNNNTLIIGGSGSGKTRGYVLPNLLNCNKSKYSPSVVVTDPKGEILGKIGHHLEKNGYQIKVLNLKEQNRSFCFNPFRYILEEKYEEQISTLVSCIMDAKSDKKEQKSNDPFWDEMSKVLLKAIFYATYEGFPKEEQNITNVMQLFRWFEIGDDDDRIKNPTKLDIFFEEFGDKYGVSQVATLINNFYKTFINNGYCDNINFSSEMPMKRKDICDAVGIPLMSSNTDGIDAYMDEIKNIAEILKDNDYFDEKIRDVYTRTIEEIEQYKKDRATDYENSEKPVGVYIYEKYGDVNTNPALRNWEDFRSKTKGKTAQSVTATALAKLAPFDEEQIRRIFSKDEMELDLVGERKTALFIVLPPTKTDYNFIANVLYTQLFEQLEYCATVKHNQQLPVPVRFILDEFYNTGRIASFENILSYARSFGIGISIILQSLDQIKEMYEKSWGTILDNCSTFLYLGGIRHNDTLKYISDLLGKGTFDKKTTSRTKGKQSSTSTSYDKIGRELLDVSEIQRLNRKKCLLFISGYQPCLSQKFNYITHKNYKATSDYNKKNLYYYSLPEELNSEINQNNSGVQKNKEAEGIEAKFRPQKPIVWETDQNKILEKLNNNVFNMELESGEEVRLADDDYEEMDIICKLVEEEEQSRKEQMKTLLNNIPPIEKVVVKDIVDVAEKITNDVENFEISPTEEDEWEDDSADEIIDGLKIMYESMVADNFAEDVMNIENIEEPA